MHFVRLKKNWMYILQSKITCIISRLLKYYLHDIKKFEGHLIPEVSWVGLLLEGMEGFPSPFESLRTILWYWSHFSVGLYDVKYNPTEKQLVILLSLLLLKKEPPPPGIEPGTIRSEARRSTRWAIEALLEKEWIFKVFIPKTANMQYRYGARSKNWRGGGQFAGDNLPPGWNRVNLSAKMHGPKSFFYSLHLCTIFTIKHDF